MSCPPHRILYLNSDRSIITLSFHLRPDVRTKHMYSFPVFPCVLQVLPTSAFLIKSS
jgi:hypothetical protein